MPPTQMPAALCPSGSWHEPRGALLGASQHGAAPTGPPSCRHAGAAVFRGPVPAPDPPIPARSPPIPLSERISRDVTKTRTLALALALALPATSATAFSLRYERPQRRAAPAAPFTVAPTAGPGVHDRSGHEHCAARSAAEGNASQQARTVKQYGQTAGGHSC